MTGCILIVIIFFCCALILGISEGIFGDYFWGIFGIIAVFVLNVYNAWEETTPKGIEKLKKKHWEIKKRCIKNASLCPRCKSTSINTSWVDPWKIGKIGREQVYICNECGFRWQLNSRGNPKTF